MNSEVLHSKKHKRKVRHVVLVTSNDTATKAKQLLFRPAFLWTIITMLCIFIGVFIGFFSYEARIWSAASEKNAHNEGEIARLSEENSALLAENNSLKEQNQILSDTVNAKTQSEAELSEQLDKQALPTIIPFTGSVSNPELKEGDDPLCEFKVSIGSTVVAAASGTVTGVTDDIEYGRTVTVDHGNGYVTIYRNKGDANVKTGDSLVQGSTIYLITKDNETFGYQIKKDGEYINPLEMIEING